MQSTSTVRNFTLLKSNAMKTINKTAGEALKARNSVPVDNSAGPEDGRDQNIAPGSSHTYDPDNGKSKRLTDHNAEVYREGEAVNGYPDKETGS